MINFLLGRFFLEPFTSLIYRSSPSLVCSAAKTSKSWSNAIWNARTTIILKKDNSIKVVSRQLRKLTNLRSLRNEAQSLRLNEFMSTFAQSTNLDLLSRLEELNVTDWPIAGVPLLSQMTRLRTLFIRSFQRDHAKRSNVQPPVHYIFSLTSLERLYWSKEFGNPHLPVPFARLKELVIPTVSQLNEDWKCA